MILIMILGLIFAAMILIGLGIFAGGAMLIVLAKLVLPVIVIYMIARIIFTFLKEIGG